MKGNPACMELFKVIKTKLKRKDLIPKIETLSVDIESRGNCRFQMNRTKLGA